MQKNRKTLIGLVAFVIVAIAAIIGVAASNDDSSHSHHDATSTKPATSQPQGSVNTPPTSTTEEGTGAVLDPNSNATSQAATLTYTNNGFSPASLTVKSGDVVTVMNNSSTALYFATGPHDNHTNDSELNVGELAPGASKAVTVTKKGDYSFHNHHNDAHAGALHVQ